MAQANQITLILELRPNRKPQFSLPMNIGLPVQKDWHLNHIVDIIEMWFMRQALQQGSYDKLQVIYVCNKADTQAKLNYNQPVSNYFKANDTIQVYAEVSNEGAPIPEDPAVPEDEKVPVTVITGFLGSGKTTLLNRILKEKHGKKIMVIQNEFGAVEIDGTLAKNTIKAKEDIVVLDNGCMCCTVRGDLVKAFSDIMDTMKKNDVKVDGVMVETTGLADPAPVIQTFFQTKEVANFMRLDGVLTVVDAKNVEKHLDEKAAHGKVNEAVEQVVYADRILLNKLDLVNRDEVIHIKEKIRSINSFARIIPTTRCSVKLEKILNIGAFSLKRILERDTDFLEEAESDHEHEEAKEGGHGHGHGEKKKEGHGHGHGEKKKEGHGHGHGEKKKEGHGHGHGEKKKDGHGHDHDGDKKKDGHGHGHGHSHKEGDLPQKSNKKIKTQKLRHSSGVSSLGLVRDGEVSEKGFNQFMGTIIQKMSADMYRMKGIIALQGNPKKTVFHAIHELLEANDDQPWGKDEKRVNKMVFIGKNLNIPFLTRGFEAILVKKPADKGVKRPHGETEADGKKQKV